MTIKTIALADFFNDFEDSSVLIYLSPIKYKLFSKYLEFPIFPTLLFPFIIVFFTFQFAYRLGKY